LRVLNKHVINILRILITHEINIFRVLNRQEINILRVLNKPEINILRVLNKHEINILRVLVIHLINVHNLPERSLWLGWSYTEPWYRQITHLRSIAVQRFINISYEFTCKTRTQEFSQMQNRQQTRSWLNNIWSLVNEKMLAIWREM